MKRWRSIINNLTFDVIVVGGGAAGLMAAGTAAEQGKKVLLFDKNEKLARKVRITGKGRCNVCNHCQPQEVIGAVPGNGRFLHSAVNRFSPQDTMAFFEQLGVPLKTERGNRVFPVSDKADDIADALAGFIEQRGVEVMRTPVTALCTEEGRITGLLAGKQCYRAPKVLVATGGASYRATGSTGDGYRLAKSVGHSTTEPRPSLVALTSPDGDCGEMQGLSLKNCGLKLLADGKCIYEDFGELLFTHFGVSGPIVLSASAHMREASAYSLVLDLKPALSFEQLEMRLLRDFEKNANKNYENALTELLPRKMIPVMLRRSGISGDLKCHSITREQRHRVISCLKNFLIEINGFRSLNEAIVTAGGVNVREINPKTMESKLIQGLYFAGEVIDVDAYTGGFNLQIAFSTGFLAGTAMAE